MLTHDQKEIAALIEILLLAAAVTYLFPKAVWTAHKTGEIKGYLKGTSYSRDKTKFKFYAMLVFCYFVMFMTYLALYAMVFVPG